MSLTIWRLDVVDRDREMRWSRPKEGFLDNNRFDFTISLLQAKCETSSIQTKQRFDYEAWKPKFT